MKREEESDKLERNKYKKLSKLIYINKWPNYLKRRIDYIFSLGKVNRNSHYRRSGYLIEESPMTNYEIEKFKYKGKKRMEQLKKIYKKLCQKVSLDQKYIFSVTFSTGKDIITRRRHLCRSMVGY